MHHFTRSRFALLVSTLLILFVTGCSREAKKARYLGNADRSYAEGRYEEAEIDYKNVLQIDRLNPRAIRQLGLIYADQGRTGRAVAFIMKASELLPDDLDLRLKLGQRDLAIGKLKDAEAAANYILDRRPQDPDAPLLLAAALGSSDEVQAARQRLGSLPAPAPDSAPVLTALGTIEYRQQHMSEAEALCRRAIAADPNYASAYASLGLVLLARNDRDGAEAALKHAADLSPLRSPRRLQYAQFKLRVNDAAGSKAVLKELTEKAPDYLPAWVALAQIALVEKKYSEGLEVIGKALSRDSENLEARILQGQLLIATNDLVKAIAEFEKLTAAFPKLPAAHYELGRAYAAAGDTAKAIDSLTTAVTLAPNNVEAIIPLATLTIRKGDMNTAIVLLKRLIAQRPELPMPRLLLADAYRGQGNFDDAIAIYNEVEKGAPRNAEAPFLRGQVLLQQGKLAAARASFQRAAELSPDIAAAPEQLVNVDLAEKNYAAAQARAEAYSAAHPKEAGPYLWLSRVFLAQKDEARAEEVLKKAIQLQPESQVPYFILASLYFNTNQHQKALTNLTELIAKNPKDKSALMLMGVLYDELKNHTAARESYEKALAIDPKFSAALNNLAYLYSESFNDLDRAQTLAQRAREILPQEPHTADTLGWILYKKRQYAWAMVLLAESAGKLPASPEIQYHLGMAHYMLGNEDAARGFLQHALELNKTFNGADVAAKSLELLALGSEPGDKAALEKAVADRPDDPVALERLAAVYERAGEVEKAVEANQAALKISPNYVKVMLGLVRLYAKRNETDKALEMAKAARKAAPLDPEAAATLGRAAFQNRDFQWARSLLLEAQARQPDNADIQFDFALATYSVGRVVEARSALKAALDASPSFRRAEQARRMIDMIDLAGAPLPAGQSRISQALSADASDVSALMAKAALDEQKGGGTDAKEAYEAALKRFPDFAPAKRGLALLYAKSAEDDKSAFELATRAREAFPDDADLAAALGTINYRRGEFSRAASLLTESTLKKPDNAEAFYYLGLAQTRLKNTAGAAKSLQQALDLGLKPELASEARKTLAGAK